MAVSNRIEKSSPMSVQDIQDLKVAAYFGCLLLPLLVPNLVRRIKSRGSSVDFADGVVTGALGMLPRTLMDAMPVLERIALEPAVEERLKLAMVKIKLTDMPGLDVALLRRQDLVAAIQESSAALRELVNMPRDSCTIGARTLVYTDGACSGNPGPGGTGVVVILRDGEVLEHSEAMVQTTNNRAELSAIKQALELLPDSAGPVTIYTDSRYAVDVLTRGYKIKANRELVLEIRSILKEYKDLQILKVPGHAELWYNERADELARLACAEAKGRQ